MTSFNDYLARELNKTSDEKVKNTVIRKESKDIGVDDVLKSARPEIWTAREIDGTKYLFFGGKKLDVTDLRKQVRQLYSRKGYADYGFSKLTESDLVRYPRVKDVLTKCFSIEFGDTLDAGKVAEQLFNNELNEFTWKPEDY